MYREGDWFIELGSSSEHRGREEQMPTHGVQKCLTCWKKNKAANELLVENYFPRVNQKRKRITVNIDLKVM